MKRFAVGILAGVALVYGGLAAAYGALASRSPRLRLAGGEAAHNVHMARHLIEYGKVGFVQIDCGRIGGIGPAKRVADHAVARGVTYAITRSRRIWR